MPVLGNEAPPCDVSPFRSLADIIGSFGRAAGLRSPRDCILVVSHTTDIGVRFALGQTVGWRWVMISLRARHLGQGDGLPSERYEGASAIDRVQPRRFPPRGRPCAGVAICSTRWIVCDRCRILTRSRFGGTSGISEHLRLKTRPIIAVQFRPGCSKTFRDLEIRQTRKKFLRCGFLPTARVLRFQGKRPGIGVPEQSETGHKMTQNCPSWRGLFTRPNPIRGRAMLNTAYATPSCGCCRACRRPPSTSAAN